MAKNNVNCKKEITQQRQPEESASQVHKLLGRTSVILLHISFALEPAARKAAPRKRLLIVRDMFEVYFYCRRSSRKERLMIGMTIIHFYTFSRHAINFFFCFL